MEKGKNKDLVKFDLKRLKGKEVVVNCVTKEQFQNFIDWSYSLNYFNSKSNFWKDNTVNSCLKLSSDLTWTYDNIDWFKNRGYEIISYEESLLKEPNEEPKEDTKPTKLSDFLKENDCYEKFINNFDKEYSYNIWKRKSLNSFLYAFTWEDTSQGSDYWNTLNNSWIGLKHKENDLKDFFEDKTEEEQPKETLEEVFPFDKAEVKLLVEFLQNKINLTKETFETDINRYTSLMNKYQTILKGEL